MTIRAATGCLWLLVLLGACAGQGRRAPTGDTIRPGPVDHHVHVRTAAAADAFARFGQGGGGPAPGPVTGEDLVAALDSAGLSAGLVLSTGYVFGAPEIDLPNEAALTRAENDYVAEQVAAWPTRLIGACSVNPLADYALAEIERCIAEPRLRALKLHLANSDLDLRDSTHLARLGEVFRILDRNRFPAVVHMRTRREDYGAEDARRFIDAVLVKAPNVPVQIAHMAGWGGYDDATDAALGEFLAAFADGRLDPGRFTFDLGAVVFNPALAGADTALARRVEASNVQLAERIRQLGPGRVVYATDWPGWPPTRDPVTGIAAYRRSVRALLPLTAGELDRLLAATSPWINGAGGNRVAGSGVRSQ